MIDQEEPLVKLKIMNVPKLTREDEVELCRRWREENDEKALQRLIESIIPMARLIAKKFYRSTVDREDIEQEAFLGIAMAARKFDPTKGFRFITYAWWWARMGCIRAVKWDAGKPEAGVVPQDVDKILTYEHDPEERYSRAEREHLTKERVSDAMEKLREFAGDRDLEVIRMRWLDEEKKHTLEECGKRFKISRERARQIEKLTMKRLRPMLRIAK